MEVLEYKIVTGNLLTYTSKQGCRSFRVIDLPPLSQLSKVTIQNTGRLLWSMHKIDLYFGLYYHS